MDRLCWRGLCFRIFLTCRDSLVLAGSWFWHFLAFLAPGAVLWRDREASESAPRKAADEAAEASKIGPRRVENRAPRRPKWPPGGLWGPLGRQLGARWPPRPLWKRSWAALGAVLAALGPLLAPLWAVLALPGGPREAPGGSGEGLREAILVLFWMVQRQKLKKRPKTCYFNDFEVFWSGFRHWFSPSFCLRGTRPAKQPTAKNHEKPLVFVGRKPFARFFADTAQGKTF